MTAPSRVALAEDAAEQLYALTRQTAAHVMTHVEGGDSRSNLAALYVVSVACARAMRTVLTDGGDADVLADLDRLAETVGSRFVEELPAMPKVTP